MVLIGRMQSMKKQKKKKAYLNGTLIWTLDTDCGDCPAKSNCLPYELRLIYSLRSHRKKKLRRGVDKPEGVLHRQWNAMVVLHNVDFAFSGKCFGHHTSILWRI